MHICIDNPHGLSNRSPGVFDPGAAVLGGLTEYGVARGMAVRLKADFEALGWIVTMTEGPLASRDDRAKAVGAVFFFSCHVNAGGGHGCEVFLDGRASRAAGAFANYYLAQMMNLGFTNRGVKGGDWLAVLRAHPSDALVELFFGDNATDLARYQKNVDAIELALFNAVLVGHGYRAYGHLPRKPATVPVKKYAEIYGHIAAEDLPLVMEFFRDNGDALHAELTDERYTPDMFTAPKVV